MMRNIRRRQREVCRRWPASPTHGHANQLKLENQQRRGSLTDLDHNIINILPVTRVRRPTSPSMHPPDVVSQHLGNALATDVALPNLGENRQGGGVFQHQCTAQTKRRKRCGHLLDYGQMNTFSWLPVKGGFVMGFDYDGDSTPATRALAIRIESRLTRRVPREDRERGPGVGLG